ncbi:MAG: 1-deoxy-D-xylulose-5-phosphate synthase [Candidatus Hydrogenedentes bacterium ADurb.Bin101]|nr:MAG: 1-deoxy-D-xylulose-5-phosphate synthase [Candidatus Hydrogenedentes bacterium ADurb.Bin101]
MRKGKAGYVVSYGDMLCRCLDAVDRLREEGMDVGLINKPTLNVVDEAMMKKIGARPFVLVVESQNVKTGLGSRFGSWLLERGLTPKYAAMGVTQPGRGGLGEHMFHQGLDADSILEKIKEMVG